MIYIQEKKDNVAILWDGLEVPLFGDHVFSYGPHPDFSKEQTNWIRDWFRELMNGELSEILGVSVKTITNMRGRYGIKSSYKRQTEYRRWVNAKRMEDPEERQLALARLEQGRKTRLGENYKEVAEEKRTRKLNSDAVSHKESAKIRKANKEAIKKKAEVARKEKLEKEKTVAPIKSKKKLQVCVCVENCYTRKMGCNTLPGKECKYATWHGIIDKYKV